MTFSTCRPSGETSFFLQHSVKIPGKQEDFYYSVQEYFFRKNGYLQTSMEISTRAFLFF